MRIDIVGLTEWRDRLAAARPAEILQRTLATEAERLADSVRAKLATPPDSGPHDTPWARTGALRDSIRSTVTDLSAAISTNDPAAVLQELGTVHLPPRPFLAPAAAESAPKIASTIADTLADHLRNPTQPAQPANGDEVKTQG